MPWMGAARSTCRSSWPPRLALERAQLDLPPGPLALLTIADDGPGMTPEVQSRCLEPFFTTKDRGHGSGLGLPTVYGLVKERGGQLHIDSQVDEGTSIRIWLPICRDASLTAETEPGESWPRHRTLAGRVLLIEDDDDLRVMAERTLSSIGLYVVEAGSAEEGLRLYETETAFSVVVTDIIRPGMSGVDLVRLIRQAEPDIPVLYMTGYAGDGGRGGRSRSGRSGPAQALQPRHPAPPGGRAGPLERGAGRSPIGVQRALTGCCRTGPDCVRTPARS